jgi:hypothetical protein
MPAMRAMSRTLSPRSFIARNATPHARSCPARRWSACTFQRLHPLLEPVIDRFSPLARREEHRQVVHVRPRPLRHRFLRGDRGLPSSPARRISYLVQLKTARDAPRLLEFAV